jgi:hypothetical protein
VLQQAAASEAAQREAQEAADAAAAAEAQRLADERAATLAARQAAKAAALAPEPPAGPGVTQARGQLWGLASLARWTTN